MPKMKTKRGAAKRLKKSASGTFRRARGWKRHKLEKKAPGRRRRLRRSRAISKADERTVRTLVPYL